MCTVRIQDVKRQGRLNTVKPGNYINTAINDIGDTFTISNSTITHDETATAPIIDDRKQKVLLSYNPLDTDCGISPRLVLESTVSEVDSTQWSYSNYKDGWYTVYLFYTEHYTYDANTATLLSTLNSETAEGVVIYYTNSSGASNFYARISSDTLIGLPETVNQTQWKVAQYTDWMNYAEMILQRGADTFRGEIGMHQILLSSGSRALLTEIAINNAKCASCCSKDLTQYSIYETKLVAAQALFCKQDFIESEKLIEGIAAKCTGLAKSCGCK